MQWDVPTSLSLSFTVMSWFTIFSKSHRSVLLNHPLPEMFFDQTTCLTSKQVGGCGHFWSNECLFWDPRGGSFKGEGRVQGPGFAALHFYLKNICDIQSFVRSLTFKQKNLYIYMYIHVIIYTYVILTFHILKKWDGALPLWLKIWGCSFWVSP